MRDKRGWWILGVAAAIVICGIWYTAVRNKESQYIAADGQGVKLIGEEPEAEELWETMKLPEEYKKIKVHVTGAVNKPDIYELDEGSRINDAIEAAGGLTEEADLDRINLAAYASDAQKIVVPAIGDVEFQELLEVMGYAASESDGLVNLNTASKSELMTLDGIGDSISQAIIDYRDNNGGFKSIEDIKKVNRIGEKTFERIRDKIVVR